MTEEKTEAQKELDEFRKTGVAYLSEEDKDMDFSKTGKPTAKDEESDSTTKSLKELRLIVK